MVGKRRTQKLRRHEYYDERIQDPDLEEHRRNFLGNPDSKLWREYHDELMKTKQRFFGSGVSPSR